MTDVAANGGKAVTDRPEDRVPRARLRAALLLLFLGAVAVYWRTGEHPFINLDDRGYVVENPPVLRGLTADGVKWAFTTFHMGNWHPLTWLSHMADVSLFGPGPAWPHRVNALLHGANAAILLLVLFRMTGALFPSLLAAALFAFHPLHVESVAWIAERKDLLCALFVLLSLLAWERHARRGGAAPYALSLFAFVLALLSKPMAVTLPFLLLLLDRWPLGRFRPGRRGEGVDDGGGAGRGGGGKGVPVATLLAEKIPFFLLSALACAVTLAAQGSSGAVHTLRETALPIRIQNAVAAYGAYLGKTVWPASLTIFYPHPASMGGEVPLGATLVSALVVAILSAAAWKMRKAMPWIAVGWLWFLGALVPVIGIVQVGSQSMADRYSYLPHVGIFVAVAFTLEEGAARGAAARRAVAALSAAAVLLLAGATYRQAGYWKDGITLYRHAVEATDGNWLAMTNLGGALNEAGRTDEAIRWFREAIRLWPNDATAWVDLGTALEKKGNPGEAEEAYRTAIRLDPREATAWYDLANLIGKGERSPEAEEALRTALRIAPRDGAAWNLLGMLQARRGDLPGAVESYGKALEADPETHLAAYNMAVAYGRMGDGARAVEAYREAVRIRPAFPEAWANLARTLASMGRMEEARGAMAKAEALFAGAATSPGPPSPPSPATP